MAFQSIIAALGIVMFSIEASAANIPLSCDVLRDEMRERNIRLFVEGEGENDPFLEEHKCVSRSEGVVSYYACKPGYEAVLKNIDGLEIFNDLDIIFNINQLRLLTGNDKEDSVLDCLPEEAENEKSISISTDTVTPTAAVDAESADEKEEEIAASATNTQAPSNQASNTESSAVASMSTEQAKALTTNEAPRTTPPPLPMCSDVSGFYLYQFRREARPKVCEYNCRFAVSVYGLPAGFRTRRYYRCCEGEAQRFDLAFQATYTCP